MTRTILTFGDSNTHGTPPIDPTDPAPRYGADTRWPTVMAATLGDVRLVEEGLPGRTTGRDDPVMGAYMNGWTGLHIALRSHGPIDLLTIMLGTNDMKTRFDPSPSRIAAGIAGLLDLALSDDYQLRHGGFEILLIAPPEVREVGPIAGEFIGAEAVAPTIAPALRDLAARRGVHFMDAGKVISVSPRDGIHFEPEDQRKLGEAVADRIRTHALI